MESLAYKKNEMALALGVGRNVFWCGVGEGQGGHVGSGAETPLMLRPLIGRLPPGEFFGTFLLAPKPV